MVRRACASLFALLGVACGRIGFEVLAERDDVDASQMMDASQVMDASQIMDARAMDAQSDDDAARPDAFIPPFDASAYDGCVPDFPSPPSGGTQVELDFPRGGEEVIYWEFNVRWTSTGVPGDVRVRLSTDGCAFTREMILANDGTEFDPFDFSHSDFVGWMRIEAADDPTVFDVTRRPITVASD